MDFTSAVSKFEKDAEKRKKAAKEKQRSEAVARRRQAVLDKERKEQAMLRKAEMEREEAEKEEKAREEARITGGVVFHQDLRVVPLQGEDDRVILPQSALEALMNQNAFDLGPMCFRIWQSSPPGAASRDRRVSHCGVREFTAAEGTVQLPKKVLDSLNLADKVTEESLQGVAEREELQEKEKATSVTAPCTSSVEPVYVTLKYVLLTKVSSVRIQPVRNLFSQVGPIKLVLEENLRHHSSLSLGDVLTVYYRGSEHTLVVKDLTLESEEKGDSEMDVEDGSEKQKEELDDCCRGGTLINTDVVVDIDISEEYLQQQQQEQEQVAEEQRAQASRVGRGAAAGSTTGLFTSSGGHRLGGSSDSQPPLPPHATAPTPSGTNAEFGHVDYDLSLDEEPAAGASHVITCKIKTPQGKTFTRRFDKAKPFQQLFAFVRSVWQQHQLPAPQQGEVLQLSTRQPARKFSELDGVVSSSPLPTFLNSGFESSKNEMFFVAFV